MARGDRKSSKVVGRRIEELRAAGRARRSARSCAAKATPAQVIIPHHDTVIETDDHVIVFVPHKRMVREVERLFQVSATFF